MSWFTELIKEETHITLTTEKSKNKLSENHLQQKL